MAELEYADVDTLEKFTAYMQQLSTEVRLRPDLFENLTTENFLEAAAAWVEGMGIPSVSGPRPIELPDSVDWSFIALLISAALIYE
ncbi:hypothetical protein ACFXK0_03135 [Nocardia sp. NPDC059177]|uniref:DUF7660 family protein n=1 Tax=Nocardia sp. NPDC059177 TaxID=3346759 RepID=UPI0036B53B2A